MGRRLTIADVAREAGVSKAAASYALNGRPGVSDATRDRVLAIAAASGYRPDLSARVLAGRPSRMVGMALRPSSVEPLDVARGLESVLSAQGVSLILHVVENERAELDLYRDWRVDGVVLLGDVSREPGLPAVVVGPPIDGLPGVWWDDDAAMTAAVGHLLTLGHRRIGWVGDAAGREMFRRACAGRAVAIMAGPDPTGRALLSRPDPPTAIIYGDDLLAVAGLAAARETGRADLSVLAWTDSPVCERFRPSITALRRDMTACGALAAKLLLTAAARVDLLTVVLAVRESTRPICTA